MTKLKWGMIGGGEGSQIGPAHRIGAGLDGEFDASQPARSITARGRPRLWQTAGHRARPCLWRLARDAGRREKTREDRIDLVTVATPNATHYEITKAFLEAGFHVLCEKPMTMTVEEGEDIVRTARRPAKICAVNYGYTGYSLVSHMKAMVARGDLGASPPGQGRISPMATMPMRR
jgi:predicted dehydrogenase